MNSLRHHNLAFTLIEMLIVITIMALLTTAAVLSFSRPLRSAQTNDAIEILRIADADARRAAHSFNRPVILSIDFDSGVIERREAQQDRPTFRAALPRTLRIDEIRIGPNLTQFDDASIQYSPLGLSPTYAVRVTSGQSSQWLVFAGLSGQMSRTDNEARVAEILAR